MSRFAHVIILLSFGAFPTALHAQFQIFSAIKDATSSGTLTADAFNTPTDKQNIPGGWHVPTTSNPFLNGDEVVALAGTVGGTPSTSRARAYSIGSGLVFTDIIGRGYSRVSSVFNSGSQLETDVEGSAAAGAYARADSEGTAYGDFVPGTPGTYKAQYTLTAGNPAGKIQQGYLVADCDGDRIYALFIAPNTWRVYPLGGGSTDYTAIPLSYTASPAKVVATGQDVNLYSAERVEIKDVKGAVAASTSVGFSAEVVVK